MIKASYYQRWSTRAGPIGKLHAGQYGYAGSNWGLLWSTYNTPGRPVPEFTAMAESIRELRTGTITYAYIIQHNHD